MWIEEKPMGCRLKHLCQELAQEVRVPIGGFLINHPFWAVPPILGFFLVPYHPISGTVNPIWACANSKHLISNHDTHSGSLRFSLDQLN